MTDTLPDLRVTIAESMEALNVSRHDGVAVADQLWRGAQTLRWCAQREALSYEEMKANLAAAREARESAEILTGELVDNIKYAVSKWLHGEGCTALMIDGERGCDCGMAKMRQSVLDAVA